MVQRIAIIFAFALPFLGVGAIILFAKCGASFLACITGFCMVFIGAALLGYAFCLKRVLDISRRGYKKTHE